MSLTDLRTPPPTDPPARTISGPSSNSNAEAANRSIALLRSRGNTESLLDMNEEVVKIILETTKDIWKHKELSVLVDDYFENGLLTSDICTALDAGLKRSAHLKSFANLALQRFEEEHCTVNISEEGSVNNYSRILEELRNVRRAGDPFTADFFKVLNPVISHLTSFLERLQTKKRKLDDKWRRLKAWRRVSNVMFVVVFVSSWIGSVVAAAVSAPPVVTALAAAASVPLAFAGRWANFTWKKLERDLMEQREVISSMQIGIYVIIRDLDNIRVLANKPTVEALLETADFAIASGGEDLVVAMDEIKKKTAIFIETFGDLSERTNRCTQDLVRARAVILQRIVNNPSS